MAAASPYYRHAAPQWPDAWDCSQPYCQTSFTEDTNYPTYDFAAPSFERTAYNSNCSQYSEYASQRIPEFARSATEPTSYPTQGCNYQYPSFVNSYPSDGHANQYDTTYYACMENYQSSLRRGPCTLPYDDSLSLQRLGQTLGCTAAAYSSDCDSGHNQANYFRQCDFFEDDEEFCTNQTNDLDSNPGHQKQDATYKWLTVRRGHHARTATGFCKYRLYCILYCIYPFL